MSGQNVLRPRATNELRVRYSTWDLSFHVDRGDICFGMYPSFAEAAGRVLNQGETA